jgi:uncharacterized PurR-regulated membrane protein YhhQ (DUF165 family)
MATHWVEIALVDYGFKIAISLLFFLPAYGALMSVLKSWFARPLAADPA